MPGGYLRATYPLPEECLDLGTWQKFHDFDTQGYEGWFDIDIDTDALTMTIRKAAEQPRLHPRSAHRRSFVTEIADCFGALPQDGKRLPAPFIRVSDGVSFSLT